MSNFNGKETFSFQAEKKTLKSKPISIFQDYITLSFQSVLCSSCVCKTRACQEVMNTWRKKKKL